MKLVNIAYVFVLLSSYHGISLASDKCDNIQQQLENASLKHLSIESLKTKGGKTELTLGYSGFFLKENARQEGRRVISHLKKCNKVKYGATKTLFGYTLNIKSTKLDK